MSEILSKFNIYGEFPLNLRQNIKSVYVSRYYKINISYCVLNDNKVYGYGKYILGFLNYDKSEEKYVLIIDFNDKNFQEFYEGFNCMFARNEINEIFAWGGNLNGELARGYVSEKQLRAEKISFFDKTNIIEISCRFNHCLALSSDGLIYGWGDNKFGQVGCGSGQGEIICTPIKINLKEKIKFIHSANNFSLAVSFDGNTYYWGKCGNCNFYNPVELKESIKIKSILSHSMCSYILSFEGIIYILNEGMQNLVVFCDLTEIEKESRIVDLWVDILDQIICETEDCVYVCKISGVDKTTYKTLFEYFLFDFKDTYKTIHLKDNQLFVLDFKPGEENPENLVKEFNQIYPFNKCLQQNDVNLSLRNFRISNDLPQILESNVKYYYQSYPKDHMNPMDPMNYFGIFVMNDSKVYSFGYNESGKLGLGHNRKVYQFTEIIELKEKNIQEFFEGPSCMFARNVKNEIFSWEEYSRLKLGRGYLFRYLKPAKISYFDGKSIIDIRCGKYHCLALSSDGRLCRPRITI